MRNLILIVMGIMIFLISAMTSSAVDSVEIRGKVATEGATWTADDFAGFYYDLDDKIKTEELTTVVTDGKLAEPDGLTYNTKATAKDFEFEDWGQYNVIGFIADKYFAGYLDTADATDDVLFEKSDDENVLADKQLLKILVDNDDLVTVTSGTPLKMEEGYVLGIRSIDIDGNKVYLELSKDGAIVDSKAISPSKTGATMEDKTYYYKKDVGDSKDVVIVAAHFKNAFRGADQDLATIDGLWQLSDTPTDVSENAEYDKMTIQTVTSDSITMNNEGNDINLSNGKDVSLMGDLSIRTADPSADEGDVLRYYVYKETTEPGTYEIRGNVATGSATWNADTFPGFYYNIDGNIKTEELAATVTDRKLLQPDGVIYNTKAESTDFEFEDWGQVNVMGFLAEKYFSAYLDRPDSIDDILFEESDDENVLVDKQLLKILVDNDDELTFTANSPLKLEEGYELAVKSIDIDGNRVSIELTKDGVVVDKKVISPSKDGATMLEKTYYYRKDIGDSKDVVIVAAHFKNAFRGADLDLATVDGLWQLSDTPIDVSENTEYDKMTIQTVTADSIIMNNEDNDINLSNGKDISLMGGVRIKTADTSADEEDVLRWYIYKKAIIESEGAEAEPTAEAAAADPFEEAIEETTAEAIAENHRAPTMDSGTKDSVAVYNEATIEGAETELTTEAEAGDPFEEAIEETDAGTIAVAEVEEKPTETAKAGSQGKHHRAPTKDSGTKDSGTKDSATEPTAEAETAVEEAAETAAAEEKVTETADYNKESKESEDVEADDIDRMISKLPNGTITTAVPKEMKQGESKQFLIAISRTPNLSWSKSESFTRELDDREKVKPKDIESDVLAVSQYMKVLLIPDDPDDFDIEKHFDSDKQYIPFNEFAVWKWMVTPKKSGELKIRMHAVVLIDDNPTREFDVYSKTYAIESNPWYSLKGFIEENGIVGLIVTAVIGLIVWLIKRKLGGAKD